MILTGLELVEEFINCGKLDEAWKMLDRVKTLENEFFSYEQRKEHQSLHYHSIATEVKWRNEKYGRS
jgi:hypothetical protein